MSLDEGIEKIRSRIKEIQSPQNPNKILFKHDPTGLGAQISRRILAVRVALITGRAAIFPNENFFPYIPCYKPLTREENLLQVGLEPSFLFDNNSYPSVVKFDFWRFWKNESEKTLVYGFTPPELDGFSNPNLILDGIIFSTFSLLDEFNEQIAINLKRFSIDNSVLGVHFRRGDKFIETPYVPIAEYKKAICRVSERTGLSRVFVASDSPRAVEELGLARLGFDVIFDEQEQRFNNASHKFLLRNRHLARQETFSALRNIYLLSNCSRIVGQDNAHFARLAAGAISVRRNTPDFGELIPGGILLERRYWHAIYRCFHLARGIGKKIFPGLTISNQRPG